MVYADSRQRLAESRRLFQQLLLPIEVQRLLIQGVHKVRVHFKKFITLFLFVIEIICKNV